jgi:hypothetical protein
VTQTSCRNFAAALITVDNAPVSSAAVELAAETNANSSIIHVSGARIVGTVAAYQETNTHRLYVY